MPFVKRNRIKTFCLGLTPRLPVINTPTISEAPPSRIQVSEERNRDAALDRTVRDAEN